MYRRPPQLGDIMVIDYSFLNAIVVVNDRSTDPYVTNGQGSPTNPAYRMDYIVGVKYDKGSFGPCIGSIWLNDDPNHMSIVGVNGYPLPLDFYGVNVPAAIEAMGGTVIY